MQRPLDILYAEYYTTKNDLAKLKRKNEIAPNQWLERRMKEMEQEIKEFDQAIQTIQRIYTEEIKTSNK